MMVHLVALGLSPHSGNAPSSAAAFVGVVVVVGDDKFIQMAQLSI